MRRKSPTGSVYQSSYKGRDGKRHKSTTWFLKYYVNGKPLRESTGTENRDEAIRILRQKLAGVARYSEYSQQVERVLVGQLLDLVVEDYQFNERGSSYDTKHRIEKHLRPAFGHRRAVDITTPMIKKYTADRAKEAAAATVNKELAFLRRAFKLGQQHEPPLVQRFPHIRMLPLDNAREGIIEHELYRSIRDALPSYARIAFVISYHTGSRKGEIAKIRLDKIDFKRSRIDLPGRTTKNKKARFLPIYGDMAAELSMAISLAQPGCPFLVQDKGRRVEDWEKSWARAVALAGADEALFHDLRRTALTNMIEAGFSEKEAMEISGHRTRAVFDRYHIVSERRLNQLRERMEAHMRQKDEEGKLMGKDNGQRQNAKIQ
jgi:integrase